MKEVCCTNLQCLQSCRTFNKRSLRTVLRPFRASLQQRSAYPGLEAVASAPWAIICRPYRASLQQRSVYPGLEAVASAP